MKLGVVPENLVERQGGTVESKHGLCATGFASALVVFGLCLEFSTGRAARTEAADQAIASFLGSATRRRFGLSHKLDLYRDLLADLVLARQLP